MKWYVFLIVNGREGQIDSPVLGILDHLQLWEVINLVPKCFEHVHRKAKRLVICKFFNELGVIFWEVLD